MLYEVGESTLIVNKPGRGVNTVVMADIKTDGSTLTCNMRIGRI